MPARIVLTALLALPLAATAGLAQSFTLKTKEFVAPGKSIGVTASSTTRSSVTVVLGGKVLDEDKKVAVEEMEFTETVLEAGDKKPNKFTHTFIKALKGTEGALAKQSYAGKTIVYELKGGTYQVTAKEGDVDAKDLDEFAKKANRPKVGQALYPKKAVQVGESWAIGKEALALLVGEIPEEAMDFTKMQAQGKLLKAYKKASQQWGTIQITGSVPVKKLGPAVLEKPIDLQIKVTGDIVIDGSSTAGQMNATMSIKGQTTFTQNNMTFTLDIAIAGDGLQEQTGEK